MGDLRFEAPVPWSKHWDDVRPANTWGSPCLQFDAVLRGRILGDENCLFLNIFTPSVISNYVMFYVIYFAFQ